MPRAKSYEQDFNLWQETTAKLIRERKFDEKEGKEEGKNGAGFGAKIMLIPAFYRNKLNN